MTDTPGDMNPLELQLLILISGAAGGATLLGTASLDRAATERQPPPSPPKIQT